MPEDKQPLAKYQGSSHWGEKFGTIHFFTIMQDIPANKLVIGTTVSSKVVAELGGKFKLEELKKDDLVYR